jgi:hypothetical protein
VRLARPSVSWTNLVLAQSPPWLSPVLWSRPLAGKEQTDRLAHRLAYWLTGVTRGGVPRKFGVRWLVRADPGQATAEIL